MATATNPQARQWVDQLVDRAVDGLLTETQVLRRLDAALLTPDPIALHDAITTRRRWRALDNGSAEPDLEFGWRQHEARIHELDHQAGVADMAIDVLARTDAEGWAQSLAHQGLLEVQTAEAFDAVLGEAS